MVSLIMYSQKILLFNASNTEAFPDILQGIVFDPLNITASTFENPLPEEYWEKVASAHGKWGQPIYEKWLVYPEMGAVGLWTTPTNLASFVNEIMLSWKGQSEKVLSQETVKEMLKVPWLPVIKPQNWRLKMPVSRIAVGWRDRGFLYLSRLVGETQERRI